MLLKKFKNTKVLYNSNLFATNYKERVRGCSNRNSNLFGLLLGRNIVRIDTLQVKLNYILSILREVTSKGGRVIFIGSEEHTTTLATAAGVCGQLSFVDRFVGKVLSSNQSVKMQFPKRYPGQVYNSHLKGRFPYYWKRVLQRSLLTTYKGWSQVTDSLPSFIRREPGFNQLPFTSGSMPELSTKLKGVSVVRLFLKWWREGIKSNMLSYRKDRWGALPERYSQMVNRPSPVNVILLFGPLPDPYLRYLFFTHGFILVNISDSDLYLGGRDYRLGVNSGGAGSIPMMATFFAHFIKECRKGGNFHRGVTRGVTRRRSAALGRYADSMRRVYERGWTCGVGLYSRSLIRSNPIK
jgi:hypothetical protein